MLELRCAERHEMKYISMSCVAVSCTWCTVLRLRNVYSIEPAWCSLYYRSDMQEQKARWSVLVWQRNGLLKDSSPPLFFSCVFLGGLWTHGKVNSLWGHSSCLATEKKHFCLNFFKCSRVPVSALAHVSRSERADAAHITSSLVLTSRFFGTLTLFFFNRSYRQFPPFLRCLRDGSADWTKAGGQRSHIFSCETNTPGVPGGYRNPESFFSAGTSPDTPLPPLQRCSESRDLGQAQRESHYSPIGVSCDLKDR